MPAVKYDIEIEQGATFYRKLTLKDGSGNPLDLTGWTIRGQVRANQNSSLLASFTCTLLNQTTNKGQVTIVLTPTNTAAIPGPTSASNGVLKNVTYLYDIEGVRPDTTVERLLHGKAKLIPEITK